MALGVDGPGGKRGFRPYAALAGGALLSGCASLGLYTGTPAQLAMPPAAATPDETAAGSAPDSASMPDGAAVSPPEQPQIASVEPPAPLTQQPKPRPRLNRPPAPKPKEELPPAPPAAKVVIGNLLGSDFTAILHVFRSPDTVKNDNLSIVWTYAPPGCTLRLFFYPDIKTTVFHLLKYDFRNGAGDLLMPDDPCMAGILAAGFREAAPQ